MRALEFRCRGGMTVEVIYELSGPGVCPRRVPEAAGTVASTVDLTRP